MPELSVTVVALTAPVRLTVAPAVVGLMLPEMLNPEPAPLTMVKFIPVTLVALRTVAWLEGVKLKPVLVGVTV